MSDYHYYTFWKYLGVLYDTTIDQKLAESRVDRVYESTETGTDSWPALLARIPLLQ